MYAFSTCAITFAGLAAIARLPGLTAATTYSEGSTPSCRNAFAKSQ
jgi:hypothetical protein